MLEMKMKVGENKNDNRKERGIIKSKQRLPQKKDRKYRKVRKRKNIFCKYCPPIVSIIFCFLNESLI